MNLKSTYTEIVHLQSRIKELKAEIPNVFFLNVLKKIELKNSLSQNEKRLSEIRREFNIELDFHLRKEMTGYPDILTENKYLITQNEFKIQVHTTAIGFLSSTELKFKGSITPKGYLMLDIKNTNLAIDTLSSAQMSKIFEGKFDEYGSFGARSIEKQYNFFLPRIPKNFIAKCTEDFKFRMEALETEWEVDSKCHIERLIGDPFHSNQKNRSLFLKNRTALNELKLKYINSLT